MIFCNNNVYAKVWKVQKKTDKYIDLQISTSEKDKDGNYINSSWFPRCIGHAFNALKDTLKEGDRITITKCKFSNEKYTAQDGTTKSAFRFIILEASVDAPRDAEQKNETTAAPSAPETKAANDESDCPW